MRRAVEAILGCALCFAASGARADVVPPDVTSCDGQKAGDLCNGAEGVCQNAECSRLDYAHWDRDATASPPSITYACVKCMNGPPPAAQDAGNPPSKADAGDSRSGDASASTASGSDGGATADAGKSDDEKKSSSGCSVTTTDASTGPTWLALALGAWLVRRRRGGA
jgi:MYXO-CTERM domain-containing protein